MSTLPPWLAIAEPLTDKDVEFADRARSNHVIMSATLLDASELDVARVIVREADRTCRPIILHRAIVRLRQLRTAREDIELYRYLGPAGANDLKLYREMRRDGRA